jgi:hypothetical protein
MARVNIGEITESITRFLIIVFLLLALLPDIVQAATPKRILIVYAFGRDFAPYRVVLLRRNRLHFLIKGFWCLPGIKRLYG